MNVLNHTAVCLLCNLLGAGHYMNILETHGRAYYHALAATGFLDTTDKCVSLFHQMTGEDDRNVFLGVYSIDENYQSVRLGYRLTPKFKGE